MQKSLDFWVGLRYNGTVKKRQSEYTYEKGFSQWLYIRGAKTKKEKECIAFLFFFWRRHRTTRTGESDAGVRST